MMKLNIQLFASGTIDGWWEKGSGGSGSCDCQIVWTSTPNNAGNYSTVTADIQVYKSGNSTTTGTFNGVVNIDGVEYSISRKLNPYHWGNWESIGTASAVVNHNNDGTKTINISTYFTNTGTSMAGSYHTQYPTYVALDTIPRASSIDSVTNGTTEYNPVVKWTPKNSSFKYKITYSYGSYTHTTSLISPGTISQTSYSGHTIPHSIFTNAPNDTTLTATAKLTTYQSNGTTVIGEATKTFTVTLNSTEIPSVAISSVAEADATMLSLNWGIYVQNKSKLSVGLTGYGRQGSTVKSIATSISGSSYSGSSFTTNPITSSGSVAISTTITDSRNRTGTASSSVSVVAYSNPQITTAIATRSDSSGNDDDNGTYLKYSFDGSISPVSNNNAHTFRIGYKVKDTSTYTYTNIDTSNYSITKSNQLLNLNLDTSKTYIIVFEAIDSFTTSTIERQIDTGFDLMNFNPSGKSMAIGKVSEAGANEEKLEIALDTELDGKLTTTGNMYLNSSVPTLFMNNNIVLYLSDGLYVGGHGNYIVLRPSGMWDSTGQVVIYPTGQVNVNGDINCVTHKYQTDSEYIGTTQTKTFTMQNTTTGSWQLCTNEVSMTLKKGYYLLKYNINLGGQGDGLATINGAVDGSRMGVEYRQTIPVANGLISSAGVIVPIYFSTDGTHTFSCYTYNNVNCSGNSGYMYVTKLN